MKYNDDSVKTSSRKSVEGSCKNNSSTEREHSESRRKKEKSMNPSILLEKLVTLKSPAVEAPVKPILVPEKLIIENEIVFKKFLEKSVLVPEKSLANFIKVLEKSFEKSVPVPVKSLVESMLVFEKSLVKFTVTVFNI